MVPPSHQRLNHSPRIIVMSAHSSKSKRTRDLRDFSRTKEGKILPVLDRRWMAKDQHDVDNPNFDERNATWYDGCINQLMSDPNDPDLQIVRVGFQGYPPDEDQWMPFNDDNCVEHNDPRFSWTFQTKGAWACRPLNKPLAPFLTVERDNTYVPPNSYTSDKAEEKAKAKARKRKAAKEEKPAVDMKKYVELVREVDLYGTRRIAVMNPDVLTAKGITLFTKREDKEAVRRTKTWKGSWGFRATKGISRNSKPPPDSVPAP